MAQSFRQASSMRASQPFTYRNILTDHWRTNGSRWELVTAGRVVAKVVPDAVYAGMWRIDLGDGALSDMVNLTRAKEAAVTEGRRDHPQTPPWRLAHALKRSPRSQTGGPAGTRWWPSYAASVIGFRGAIGERLISQASRSASVFLACLAWASVASVI